MTDTATTKESKAASAAAEATLKTSSTTLISHLLTSSIPTFTSSGPGGRSGISEYERSVATANLLYRFTRPACVVQPETPQQVCQIIKQAKSLNVPVTIKCGGHSYAGFSTADKGILLDLVRMNKVELDMEREEVTLQGGALWGHAYKMLVNGRHDGYVINGGRCPTVGVSGFLLGGGLGPFTRSFGMGCDTMKEATVVTAKGEIVRVSEEDPADSDKGKLFWALRGAGAGNFGVVVEFKMGLCKLRNEEGLVVAGRYTWFPTPCKMEEFMETMERFYTTDWPNEMTIDSSWLCDLKQANGSELGVRFLVYYDGSEPEFDALIDEKIQHTELARQLKRRTLQEKSTRFLHETLASQWSEETIKAFPSGSEVSHKIYTSFVFRNDDAEKIRRIIAIIREEMVAFRKEFGGESGLLQVTWIHAGGQANAKERSETAFRWRKCTYHAYIMVEWQEKWLELDMRGFLKKMKAKLRPFSVMGCAAFINFPDADILSEDSERVYYGNNRQRLRRVKQIWDRDNFFKWKQGIRLPYSDAKTADFAKTASDSLPAAESLTTSSFGLMSESNSASPPPLLADDGLDSSSGDEGGIVDVKTREITDVYATKDWNTFDQPEASGEVNYGALGKGIIDLSALGF
ncbi:FAD-binding domain-containing protein [Sordaria brevicollis]|uniref:FAD-binding domain-containing protein n=1 Tax=Sordaria brevicollis TaxID=83679 RepID=A0AAE0UCL0_SORBR|nr:FAD-binding domain-containing protein [Sordaria brevicollis]